MKYLTIADICEMLNISRRTLERLKARNTDDFLSNLSNDNNSMSLSSKVIGSDNEGFNKNGIPFPLPDIMIGNSPRWEQEKLIDWLKVNGSKL